MAKFEVRFYSLVGKFNTACVEFFDNALEVSNVVKVYAESAGYTDVKISSNDEDDGGFRYTARSPGGRSGRNIAEVRELCDGDWIGHREDGCSLCDGSKER